MAPTMTLRSRVPDTTTCSARKVAAARTSEDICRSLARRVPLGRSGASRVATTGGRRGSRSTAAQPRPYAPRRRGQLPGPVAALWTAAARAWRAVSCRGRASASRMNWRTPDASPARRDRSSSTARCGGYPEGYGRGQCVREKAVFVRRCGLLGRPSGKRRYSTISPLRLWTNATTSRCSASGTWNFARVAAAWPRNAVQSLSLMRMPRWVSAMSRPR